jgi:hypothetical protein
MKELTLLNINNCYSYAGVYIELKRFIENYIVISKYYDITITVAIKVQSTSVPRVLIKNYSFKATELNKIVNNTINILKTCNLSQTYSITLSFAYNIKYRYIYLSIVLLIYIIIFIFYIYYYNIAYVNQEAIEIIKDTGFITNSNISDNNFIINTKEKPNIFTTFIGLFNKSNTAYKYFPSYFINSKFNFPISEKDFILSDSNLGNITNYKQYFILEYHNNSYYCLVNDLYDIVSEYIKNSSRAL